MNHKPDVIRSSVFLFVIGLVASAVTHLGASDNSITAELPASLQASAEEIPVWRYTDY